MGLVMNREILHFLKSDNGQNLFDFIERHLGTDLQRLAILSNIAGFLRLLLAIRSSRVVVGVFLFQD